MGKVGKVACCHNHTAFYQQTTVLLHFKSFFVCKWVSWSVQKSGPIQRLGLGLSLRLGLRLGWELGGLGHGFLVG